MTQLCFWMIKLSTHPNFRPSLLSFLMVRQRFLNKQVRKLWMGSASQWLQKGHSNQQNKSEVESLWAQACEEVPAARPRSALLGNHHARAPRWNASTVMHMASGTDRVSQKSVCNYRAVTSLGSQRYGGIACMTGEPQWMDTRSLASTGCDGKEGVLHFTWEQSSWGAWSSALGLFRSQPKACRPWLAGRTTHVLL